MLEREGEPIHPASAELASEAEHIDSEVAGHELDVFHAFRRMDEILIANFMVFHDLVERGPRTTCAIGDEAWETRPLPPREPGAQTRALRLAHRLRRVGRPMADGGEREAFLTADYNAEMLEQIARYPRVRDRAIFVGDARRRRARPFGS